MILNFWIVTLSLGLIGFGMITALNYVMSL